MKSDPWDLLSFRMTIDMVMAMIFVAVILLYLWALATRPVSMREQDPPGIAPQHSLIPAPRPAPTQESGGGIV